MFYCPNCDQALQKTRNEHGVHWACSSCEGRAVSIALLRYSHGEEKVRHLLRATASPGALQGKPCSICRHKTREVQADDGFVVDVCRPCNFVWFDWQEIELRPPGQKPDKVVRSEGELSLRQRLAIEEVKTMSREADAFDWEISDWRTIAAVFGMPVEVDRDAFRQRPIATWAVAGVVAAVSIAAFFNYAWFISQFALVPAEVGRLGGLTTLTSFLLHGGWMHLIGNLYFLITFGDNVEDFLGHKRFLLLLFGATVVGDALHIAVDPASTIPCIGASGGISGLIAFYALKFPQARIGVLFYFRPFRIPAWGWFGIWILYQLIGLSLQIAEASRVSAAAHLGGVLVGVSCWAIWRKRDPAS